MRTERFLEIVQKFLSYSFTDVDFDASKLTPEEARIGEREELDQIMTFALAGFLPTGATLTDVEQKLLGRGASQRENDLVATLATTIASTRYPRGSAPLEHVSKYSVELARLIVAETRK